MLRGDRITHQLPCFLIVNFLRIAYIFFEFRATAVTQLLATLLARRASYLLYIVGCQVFQVEEGIRHCLGAEETHSSGYAQL